MYRDSFSNKNYFWIQELLFTFEWKQNEAGVHNITVEEYLSILQRKSSDKKVINSSYFFASSARSFSLLSEISSSHILHKMIELRRSSFVCLLSAITDSGFLLVCRLTT